MRANKTSLASGHRSSPAPRARLALLLGLLLGGAGCQGALGLDSYTIVGGSAGASGSPGVGGTAGAGGPAGAGGTASPAAGSGGTSVVAGSGGENNTGGSGGNGSGGNAGTDPGGPSTDAGTDAGALGECAESQRCVPPIPVGWQGPIVLGAADAGCPSTYPTGLGEVHTDFVEGAASCDCACFLSGVSCLIRSSNGGFFEPAGSCATPPVDDDCLSAASLPTCGSTSTAEEITPSTFQSTLLSCGGATPTSACGDGTCYAASDDSKSICISAVGEVACPSGFPQPTIYHQTIADDRTCGECNCAPQGQVCQIEIEVCSVGFYYATLTEGEACTQLGSSDGQDVTLLSTAVLDQGTCVFAGRAVAGTAAPINPITVCCME